MVLSIDKKSQIQALDRTAPILPMRPGLPEKAIHDAWNERCQPFTWTKTTDEIHTKARPGQKSSFTRH